MTIPDADAWMARCLTLAAQGQSRVSPNPRVGAVLVDPLGQVLGEGWHRAYGEPHAETAAIQDALSKHPAIKLQDATLYVNLEPCHHHGQTPPCTQSILKHGIPRVVYGMSDPNPKASGGGAYLESKGVEVVKGILGAQCWRFNEAFAQFVTEGRPLVSVKLAQSLDGCVATRTGESQWISGESARHWVHQWRAESDAILTGAGTASADNPSLTVRHVEGPQPQRIVLDARGQLPAHLKLFNDQWAARTTAVVSDKSAPVYGSSLESKGGRIMRLATNPHGRIDLADLLRKLSHQSNTAPIRSILVEAGPGLATALLNANLVDRLYMFIAPTIIGNGMPSIGDLGIEDLVDACAFAEHTWEVIEPDILFRGFKHEPQR